MESRLAYCYDCQTITRAERKRVNTALHLVLALLTLGVWLLVYLLNLIVREPWRCQDCHSREIALGSLPELNERAAQDVEDENEPAHDGRVEGEARVWSGSRRFFYKLMGYPLD